MTALISEQIIGDLANGQSVKRYSLRNARGTEATFLNLGAAWVGFKRPEDEQSLVLGCETLDAFVAQKAYLGATAGRFANRIKHGQFQLNGQSFQLDINDRQNHLHGGHSGLSKQIFSSHIQLEDNKTPTLTFRYHSPAGESGYPGNVDFTIVIRLTDDDRVQFNYSATTDAPTLFNPTCHAYFNLDGQHSGSLNSHEFKLEADTVVQSDDELIPTGEILSIKGSSLDLTEWKTIGSALTELPSPDLQRAGGFDHCYCYPANREYRLLASVRSNTSKTLMECYSDLPGIQFYSGNFLGGEPINNTEQFKKNGAFCLEPGFWPDSPNQAHFPNCTIDADKPYSAIIEYTFQSVD